MTFLITPIIVLLHIAEEWQRFPAWATRHFGATSRAWFVYSHIFLVKATIGVCWMATYSPSRAWTIWAVAAQWGFFTNTIFHVATWRLFREYSPGLLTAVVLFVPATVWQIDAVELDQAGMISAIALGSLLGGLAVASLWLNMNIGWNFRREHVQQDEKRIAGGSSMKVFRSTTIALPPDTVWPEVQTATLLQHIAWPIVRFIPAEPAAFGKFEDGGRYPVKLRLLGLIPFGKQWIVTSLHESGSGDWPKQLRDNGHSALIDRWDHWITIAPGADGGTQYSDEVDVSAGIMTPFIWLFAQIFYWHRQRRWRGLARSLLSRRLIASEIAAYREARASGDTDRAWRHLERAHIIAQPYLSLHLGNHGAMLSFAIAQHDAGEIIGQVFRLALVPLGSLTGRIPKGNSGRSNVSAFEPMPISDDLRDVIDELTK